MKKILFIILVVGILAVILIVGSIFSSSSIESIDPEDVAKIFPPDEIIDEPTGILPFESSVTGKVLMGPICPVMKNPPDPDCADKPYVTTIEVIGFSTVETDKDGVYKVMLPPGEYTIQAVGGNPFPRCMSEEIIVEPDTMHEVNLSCDTGIR